VNNLFSMLGIESWKPILAALLLPPVPLLLLILVGARVMWSRRALGWLLILLGTAGIWLSACTAVGALLTQPLLHPPPALSREQVAKLRADVKAYQALTIVVLGSGRDLLAPEYGTSGLTPLALERLRYGAWLARETGAIVGFSGGTGWSAPAGPSEAEVAQRIAAHDFGVPLKWIEADSRDTRENAGHTVALLRQAGIKRVVLVTHGWHMPRAVRLFEDAAAGQIAITAAPMGMASITTGSALDWLPSARGFERVHFVLHEWLGYLAGD
jgi:uncharacterized SAM-binding protein YcdF (DUF218 family)